LNATRAGSILGVTTSFDEDFNLSMSYSMPDLKTQVMEHKTLSMVREERKDGLIDIELKCASESATSVHKTQISHPEFIVIRRLIEVEDS
jgi:hypothetical protein